MTYYSRRAWGARKARLAVPRLVSEHVEGIALHWPGIGSPVTSVEHVKSLLRAWQAQHIDVNGWSDIAYQVAVDQAGNYYRLRGLEKRSAANGDEDVNDRFGAILLVLAEGEQPSKAMIRTVQGRIKHHRRLFPHSRRIVGHQTIRPEPTACPGPAVMKLIAAGAFEPTTTRKRDPRP